MRSENEVWEWGLRMKSENGIWEWSLRMEVWEWSLRMRSENEIWEWGLRMESENGVWEWSLRMGSENGGLRMEFENGVWEWGLRMEVWEWSLRMEVWEWDWKIQLYKVHDIQRFEGNMIHIGWQYSHSKDCKVSEDLKASIPTQGYWCHVSCTLAGIYQVMARSLFVILKSGMIVCTMVVSGHQHSMLMMLGIWPVYGSTALSAKAVKWTGEMWMHKLELSSMWCGVCTKVLYEASSKNWSCTQFRC